ncbi:YkoF family thiamine/hydroxymethylpyrimidine-binding protein [Ruania zhangjianzhongii]|uniref:YkoF family thiamine/hydroxymethylpyrimidine-binding protein n=1 Tax=Ruania zhangjianzhongii TaxID=2603206 RepID=UPI0011CB5A3D|nr:YkoF family thiamine/hydroxymethylpyrimidine-binding protein [Ruania zhangjianzhongii]
MPTPPTTVFTATSYGVGARFSLHPMTDGFADLILTALRETDSRGLQISTDEVSTFLRGPEDDLLAYLADTIGAVARTGVHTAAHVLFSRGCPGEVECTVADGTAQAPAALTRPAPAHVQAAAHWALYPLEDSPTADHMAAIYAAIEHARDLGVLTGSEHYVTRLDGDLADVLYAVTDGWREVGTQVRHVASHLSLSLNSPTTTHSPAAGAR